MERAGFGIRLAATLIDGVIFGLISWIVDFIIKIAFNVKESVDPATGLPVMGPAVWLGFLATFILAVVYYVVIPLRAEGQTFGKKFTRIRVAKADGSPLTAWTLFLREFIGKFLSSLTFLIGYLIALGKQKRALHDYVAGTVVIRAGK